MPAILATQEAEQEGHGSKPAQTNSSAKPYLEKILHKKGLVKWLKV
jgi:hypothetical protein